MILLNSDGDVQSNFDKPWWKTKSSNLLISENNIFIRSDMASRGDGTGRPLPNQACNLATYHGGLQCCKHGWFLTDREQDPLIPKDKVDTYYLKWRYYFQEYVPASKMLAASHKHLHHWVFLIGMSNS